MEEKEMLQMIIDTQKEHIANLNTYIANLEIGKVPMVNQIGDTNWKSADVSVLRRLLKEHYEGNISIYDYWGIGDERKVDLCGEINQSVEFVLTDREFYKLADSEKKCAFTVDQKNLLEDIFLPMNDSNTNEGGWKSCKMRAYVNKVYAEAIPESFLSLFKQFVIDDDGNPIVDTFTLRSEVEIFGDHMFSRKEENGRQIEYYKATRNRIKCIGCDSGSAYYWWERSPYYSDSRCFCRVNTSGSANNYLAGSNRLIAPAGCI